MSIYISWYEAVHISLKQRSSKQVQYADKESVPEMCFDPKAPNPHKLFNHCPTGSPPCPNTQAHTLSHAQTHA